MSLDRLEVPDVWGLVRQIAGDMVGDKFVPAFKLLLGGMDVDGGPVSSSNPLPISEISLQITKTDRSGTITTGGTAQVLMAANASRRGWELQNNSSSDLWFNEIGGTAVATAPSFKVPPGSYISSDAGVTTSAISLIGQVSGQTFTAREW